MRAGDHFAGTELVSDWRVWPIPPLRRTICRPSASARMDNRGGDCSYYPRSGIVAQDRSAPEQSGGGHPAGARDALPKDWRVRMADGCQEWPERRAASRLSQPNRRAPSVT